MTESFQKWAFVAARLFPGSVFVYTGVSKAVSSEDFSAKIAAFRIIPADWSSYVAQGLPFFEAIAGFWLLLGWRLRVPALAVVLMTAIFAVIVTTAMIRGLNITCGCFGPRGPVTGGLALTLVLDLLLLGSSWIVYRNSLCRINE